MKGKPNKHKTTNTFRFIPFAERINQIDVRHAALYHIEHINSEKPEENETHFHITVRKWCALNLTENFKKFRKTLFGIVTLPQLIHRKEETVNVLKEYLLKEDQLCLQPLLEILVSFAKDLREDFYPYFTDFLDILIKLLKTKDAERLEWTLICLAFLFKILKPYLKRDLAAVLKRIIPLLSESQPQYINNFAAESFAFVARDIKDKKNFIHLIVNYLQKHEDAITGCGHLMFEIIKGVQGKFHSCIETFIPILLQHMKENPDHQEIIFKILTQTLEDSLQSISHKEFSIFWDSVGKYTENILSEDDGSQGLEYILRLAGQVLEHQSGKYIPDPPKFVLLLIKVICQQSSERVLEVCAQVGALLLLSTNISLSQEQAGVIVRVLLPLPYPSILINFVNNVINYSQFDLHILPPFLNFLVQSDFDSEAMDTLTNICLQKSPLSRNGLKLFEWVKYPLNLGKGLPLFMEHFEKNLLEDIDGILENPLKFLNYLICLPHVEKLDIDYCISKLREVTLKLTNIISSYNVEMKKSEKLHLDGSKESKRVRQALFLLGNIIESAAHISSCKKLKEICEIDTLLLVLLPCAMDPNYIASLHILDLYLTAYEQEHGLSLPYLSLVDSYLRQNISSPFHTVRLLTTHIYKLFENIDELKKTVQVGSCTESFSVFTLCYSIESTKPSIQEYRTQLSMLQKMAFNSTQYSLVKDTNFALYPLSYMLGVLYMNFKLLWEPVTEIVAGYGNTLPIDEFWPTFHKALAISFFDAQKDSNIFQFYDEMDTQTVWCKDLYAEYNNISERPDLYNYRNLLLQVMTNCIQTCEAKNRDVVVLFLNFIDNEYRKNDSMSALKINVEKHDKMEIDEVPENVTPENEDETEMPENILEEQDEFKNSVSGKLVFKTLINIMQVLSQFKNPRALHKEPIFWDLYMEFLKHKNPGLQKYALDCVLNYKNKSLTPYRDNLFNLVDEKKFKDELSHFKITEDAQNIQPEDRQHVVPIILRILYGKMTSKLGADKKGGGQTRRSIVMRYLAGCNENELMTFIEMAFSYIQNYLAMPPKEIHTNIVSNTDLKAVISPGKLHSILNLFDVVREYFGGYMKDEVLGKFFKIFYAVSSTIANVLSQEEKVHKGFIKIMKNLRTIELGILRKLFDQFDKYPWSKEELHLIFETLIWPLVSRLHIEGIHSPTALLKLFNTWSQNPRYYILLVTSSDTDATLSPLPEIYKLLIAPKTTPVVVNLILDMTEKLLTLADDDDEEKPIPIESFNVSSYVAEGNDKNNINFGSKILIPHIQTILEIMKRRIANSAKSNSVNKRDLLILSRVTELVSTPELCDELLKLLLPILVNKVCMNMAEENMEYAVNTIINLLNHSKKPQVYIKHIAVLFNKVSLVEVRKLLLKLLNSIAENATENVDVLKRLAEVVTEMNAFNKRWIDQPDFDRRLDAYKKIYNLSEANDIDIDLSILIVNNCFYFIKTEKDIGLRDSAGLCLKRVLPKLLLRYWSSTDGQYLVRDTVLSLISNSLRDSKNEILRNESISLLGDLARECPEADVVLSDLAHLTNKEDREVDFFENICHLQMHRRVRAMQKFCKIAKKMLKCPSPRTLTNFILPLATMYLCDDKFSDKNTLIDACIETVATSCRLLPWYHYEVILKLYLNKLKHTTEHQKQLIRILTGILDSFHFDFSKVQNIELPKELINNMLLSKLPSKLKGKKEVVATEDITVDNDKLNNDDENNKQEIPDTDELNDTEVPVDLEKDLQAADDEIAEEEQVTKELISIPAFERVTSVAPSVAKRIIKSLSSGLLPQLNRAIGKMSEHEESHKVNRRRNGFERQEEDMIRVPIALALVKLLQKLPGDLLKFQLPGIIIKLCSFLKSPLKQVRITARDVVKKIMQTVGTKYLGVLLEHLTLLLTRGFQVHVLVATVHTVLDALKSEFGRGELDENLNYILDVCVNDLFGSLSDEKEVQKLHYKTPEAKPSKKSYVTLMIVAQNISEKCLINLLLPFKEVLQKHHSKKIVLKVEDGLRHISTGLVTNKFIDMESLFIFLHGMASDSIPDLVVGAPKREITEAQREKMLRAKPDCFIIPETPKRNREVQAKLVKTSTKANAHVLIDFSFNILYVMLRREKVPKADCKVFVDPIVPLLVDALKSDHVKVSTIALKCLATLWTIRVSTPMLVENINDIVKTIFLTLHKYATFEISKQNDNYNLVRNAFKAVTVLIKNVKYYTLEADQLKTLLLYAEEDCQNDERQANSFSLIKAILEAKLVSSELHEVMEKISKICILSESSRSREEARTIFLNYLTNYSPGKRLEKHLLFFVSQLNYELQHGRESSLKFLDMIINKLSVVQLSKHCQFLLLSVGAAMVNDAAAECRSLAATCLETLLRRVHANQRREMFDIVVTFLQDTQPVHFELAAQLGIRFVNVEQDEFKNRLPIVLPLISGKLLVLNNDASEGKFVKINLEQTDTKTDEDKQREKDHSLIQMLNFVDKIITQCPSCLSNTKFSIELDEIAQQCQIFLAYPHSWVRLRAAKILGQIIEQIKADELNEIATNSKESERGFIYYDTENAIRSLVLDLCAQYTAGVTKEMAEQVTAVLFQILKLIHAMPYFKMSNRNQEVEEGDHLSKINIRWIIYKMRKAIHVEVAKAPNSVNIRTAILSIWMHIISSIEVEDLHKIIDLIISAVVRELSVGDETAPATIPQQLARRIGKKLRRKIGDIEYGKMASEAQTKLNIKRAQRKKIVLQEKVHNPEKAAKRKLQLKEKKKQSKKVKLEMLQGKRPRPKKRKAADFDVEDKLLNED